MTTTTATVTTTTAGLPPVPKPQSFRWLRNYGTVTHGRPLARLVCFPHAGGTASAYVPWRNQLRCDVELCAVRYPLREDRLSDPHLGCLRETAARVTDELLVLQRADRLPLVLFGHSMGASIAHEVAVRFEEVGERVELLIASSRPPAAKLTEPGPPMNDALLEEVLRAMDPNNAQVLDTPELRDLVWPAIRADYDATQRYRPTPHPPLRCRVIALGGRDDDRVPVEDLAAWVHTTVGDFTLRMYQGGHFYHQEHQRTVLNEISNHVEQVYSGGAMR